MEQLKKCTNCNIEKMLTNFHKSKDGKFGVKSICKECKIILRKIEYNDNRDKHLLNKQKYYENNKNILLEKVKDYRKNRLEMDPFFKMKENIRTLIRNSFRRKFTTKSEKTINILGCTFEEFKLHIEKQFTSEMNWDNQGSYWHLDHIKPVSLATTEQELIELNHYTNFQPLFWKENLSKSNKY
jgi:hypothetical protein